MTAAPAPAIILRDYEYYGVRVCGEALAVGDKCASSMVWDDGEMTDEALAGASCLQMTADTFAATVAALEPYTWPGHDRAYLVGGNHASYGDDPGEIVLRDAVVLAVLAETLPATEGELPTVTELPEEPAR